jgi:hypothetical protein
VIVTVENRRVVKVHDVQGLQLTLDAEGRNSEEAQTAAMPSRAVLLAIAPFGVIVSAAMLWGLPRGHPPGIGPHDGVYRGAIRI